MGRIIVTGAAGFIGFHVAQKLLAQGESVLGLDNLNSYYSVQLKEDRLSLLRTSNSFEFKKISLEHASEVRAAFESFRPDRVVHLAAQAGVRTSLTQPQLYIDSNITGTLSVLEACRHTGTENLVLASSSSVYGANPEPVLSVQHRTDHPVSLYGATKKANEGMAHSYSHLFGIPTTALRFFSVYGPWGRPDMALWRFTESMLAGQPIDVYNFGEMKRDFTYIDDIVQGVLATLERVPDRADSGARFRIYNIGNHQPVRLIEFIELLEKALGIEAQKNFLPMQPGDVLSTCADISDLMAETGFCPSTPLAEGITQFVSWYRTYHNLP